MPRFTTIPRWAQLIGQTGGLSRHDMAEHTSAQYWVDQKVDHFNRIRIIAVKTMDC